MNIYKIFFKDNWRKSFFCYEVTTSVSLLCIKNQAFTTYSNISLVTRKPVFGVSDQLRLKPVYLATETS